MEVLKSRKLWVAIASFITIALNSEFGLNLDPEAIVSLAIVASAYIGGQAVVDRSKVAAELDAQKLQLNAYIIQLTEALQRLQKEGEHAN
jgi:hypothetical protein